MASGRGDDGGVAGVALRAKAALVDLEAARFRFEAARKAVRLAELKVDFTQTLVELHKLQEEHAACPRDQDRSPSPSPDYKRARLDLDEQDKDDDEADQPLRLAGQALQAARLELLAVQKLVSEQAERKSEIMGKLIALRKKHKYCEQNAAEATPRRKARPAPRRRKVSKPSRPSAKKPRRSSGPSVTPGQQQQRQPRRVSKRSERRSTVKQEEEQERPLADEAAETDDGAAADCSGEEDVFVEEPAGGDSGERQGSSPKRGAAAQRQGAAQTGGVRPSPREAKPALPRGPQSVVSPPPQRRRSQRATKRTVSQRDGTEPLSVGGRKEHQAAEGRALAVRTPQQGPAAAAATHAQGQAAPDVPQDVEPKAVVQAAAADLVSAPKPAAGPVPEAKPAADLLSDVRSAWDAFSAARPAQRPLPSAQPVPAGPLIAVRPAAAGPLFAVRAATGVAAVRPAAPAGPLSAGQPAVPGIVPLPRRVQVAIRSAGPRGAQRATKVRPAAAHPTGMQPAGGLPAAMKPAGGVPGAMQSAGGSHAAMQTAGGLPGAMQPAAGFPALAQPAAGLPAGVQPAAGFPAAVQPATGLPAVMQPATGLLPTAVQPAAPKKFRPADRIPGPRSRAQPDSKVHPVARARGGHARGGPAGPRAAKPAALKSDASPQGGLARHHGDRPYAEGAAEELALMLEGDVTPSLENDDTLPPQGSLGISPERSGVKTEEWWASPSP